MATIADFRASVRTMIRDTNSASYVYDDPEIDSFTQSAVLAYTRFKPRRKPFTLSLVSGQVQYTLPADWRDVDLEAFNKAVAPPTCIDTDQFVGFVMPTLNGAPDLTNAGFDWYDDDQFVVINPTPQGAADISFAYYAMHAVDDTSSSIPAKDYDAVVLAAASRALDALAIEKGQKMQKYKIGQGLNIDNTAVAQRLQEQAKTYWCRFEEHVRFQPFGVMG
jgi:20S proteasome alpha/beta subunit